MVLWKSSAFSMGDEKMVRTFLCYVGQTGEDMVEQGLFLLPEIEQKKIMCIKNEKQKKLSLASKLLLQKILKEQGYTLLDCISQKNGKPEILQAENFHFNISHSGEYVLLAVSSAPVGADIEWIREGMPKSLRGILSEEEREMLECAEEQKKTSLFFQLWTQKESYVKCLGGRIFAKPFLLSMVEKGRISNQYEDCFFHTYLLEGYAISVCSFQQDFAPSMEQVDFASLFLS